MALLGYFWRLWAIILNTFGVQVHRSLQAVFGSSCRRPRSIFEGIWAWSRYGSKVPKYGASRVDTYIYIYICMYTCVYIYSALRSHIYVYVSFIFIYVFTRNRSYGLAFGYFDP